jgi:hypothetical protein
MSRSKRVGGSRVNARGHYLETRWGVPLGHKLILIMLPRKASTRVLSVPVPQTDTGRRGENPKVLERTVVKELGKITP